MRSSTCSWVRINQLQPPTTGLNEGSPITGQTGRSTGWDREQTVTGRHCNVPMAPRVGALLVTLLLISALVVAWFLLIALAFLALCSTSLALMGEIAWCAGCAKPRVLTNTHRGKKTAYGPIGGRGRHPSMSHSCATKQRPSGTLGSTVVLPTPDVSRCRLGTPLSST